MLGKKSCEGTCKECQVEEIILLNDALTEQRTVKDKQLENIKQVCADFGISLCDLPKVLLDYENFLEDEYCSSIAEKYYES